MKLVKILEIILKSFVVFFVLGFPVGDRTLFDKIYDRVYPYLAPCYNQIALIANRGKSAVKDMVAKSFSNSIPQKEDMVEMQMNAQQRNNEDISYADELPFDQ